LAASAEGTPPPADDREGRLVLEVTLPNSWALKIVRGAMRDDPEIKAFEVRNARPNDY